MRPHKVGDTPTAEQEEILVKIERLFWSQQARSGMNLLMNGTD